MATFQAWCERYGADYDTEQERESAYRDAQIMLAELRAVFSLDLSFSESPMSLAQLLRGRVAFDSLDTGTISIEPTQTVGIGGGVPAEQVTPLTPVPDSVPEAPTPSIAEQAIATKHKERGKWSARGARRGPLE